MGVLLPNSRRRISAIINGKSHSSLENVSIVTDGKLLGIKEGKAEGSKVDGSAYAIAHVQIEPGTKIRVVGYGEEAVSAFKAMKEGDSFSAFLKPMGGGAYKLRAFETQETAAAA